MPRRETSDLQLAPRHLAMLRDVLATHAPQAEVWAYGSRVSGGAHECSDLDIVLRNATNLRKECDEWLDVKDALQESVLPILVDTHDWAHLPESFHRNIEREYVVVQEGAGHGI
jgi:predicted nucleotidyltransferase